MHMANHANRVKGTLLQCFSLYLPLFPVSYVFVSGDQKMAANFLTFYHGEAGSVSPPCEPLLACDCFDQ